MKSSKNILYLKAYYNAVTKCRECLEQGIDTDYDRFLKQLIFYGVRAVNTQPKRERFTREQAKQDFENAQVILSSIGSLRPAELVNIFPIEKTYDGDRWKVKDYFYTRDYLNTLDPNEPIGENALDLLWEYVNRDLRLFNIHIMSCMDNLRWLEGQASMMQEWADMNEIKTYSRYVDQKGNEFLLDKETGKTIRIERAKPRTRLRLVR